MSGLTVVIAAHSRPGALRALGRSLAAAQIEANTQLIVSIDGGSPNQSAVRAIADSIDWTAGPKRVIEHDHFGLVDHWRWCGDLTESEGNIVLLEDDLVVAPGFAQWASAALASGASDQRVAGVSLATPWFDGYRQLPFEPVADGTDALYLQVPWYDGMAWTPDMWERFRTWPLDRSVPLHASLETLDDDEWFPDAMRYLVANDRFYLMPREAQATNTGAAGAHFEERTDYFQVPLSFGVRSSWDIAALDDSLAVYDDHMELSESALRRIVADLPAEPITVDFLGARDLQTVKSGLVLTTRPASGRRRSWGASMHPLVANLVHNMAGDAIVLAPVDSCDTSDTGNAASLATLRNHTARGRTVSTKDRLRSVASDVGRKFRRD